jgi:hypothetical protein
MLRPLLAFTLVTAVCLGCTHNSPYTYQTSQFGQTTILTTDASKRSIFLHLGDKEKKFCSEPAPDAIGTIAAHLAANLAASPGPTSKAESSMQSKTETNIVELFQRSQGVQVLRDGMYRLCEAYLNGAIDKDTYADQLIALITTLDFVVPVELCTKSMEVIERLAAGNPSREAKEQAVVRDCIQAAYNFAKGVNDQALQARKAKYEKEQELLKFIGLGTMQPQSPSGITVK